MRIIWPPLLLLIFCSCHAQQAPHLLKSNKDENSLLWEISGKGLSSPSYLFGSFHLLCRSDIHFSEQLKRAFEDSKEIYLELKLDDPANLINGLMLMNMKGDKRLKDLYSADEYKKVKNFFTDSLGLSLLLFQSMKPAFLESMLYPKLLPCISISGVEEELVQLAKKENKKILGLETMAFQASVFDSIPYKDQANELLRTIDSLPVYKTFFDSMIMVYKSQRLDKIENLFSKSEFGMEENQDLLLNKRNINWVGQLSVIMKKEKVFVAVGAGHLVGKKGLIALLRKEGFILRPLLNE